MPDDRLLTTENIPEVEQAIHEVVVTHFGTEDFSLFYEHGHWWLRVNPMSEDSVTYDVVDADPGLDGSGFDFEEVG